jgi:hypothetical protein
MRSNRNDRGSVHFDPRLRELIMTMWMEGKSQDEIDRAVGRYLSNRARRRRGGTRERRVAS